MPNLILTSPTAVTRSGATKNWSGSSSGTYLPGDKSWFLRYRIVPDSPFTYLPTGVQLTVDATYDPTAAGTWIVDDSIGTGDSSAPSGNTGLNAPVSGARVYGLGNCFSDLATLNAGGYYVWLGYRADPTSYSGYAAVVSGVGTLDSNGSTSPWAGVGPWDVDTGLTAPQPKHAESSGTVTITATGGGSYAVFDVTTSLGASATTIGTYPSTANATASVTDSLGDSFTATPDTSVSIAGYGATRRELVPLSGGSGTFSFTADSRSDALMSAASSRCTASVEVTASIVTPDASTITINSLTLTAAAPPMGMGGMDGPLATSLFSGLFQGDPEEMTTAYIDNTLAFWAQCTDYASGTATDADALPEYRVYEEPDTPIATGTMALQDNANTTGFYRGQIVLSSGAGFEVGKCYCVRSTAAVSSINQAGILERFVVRANPVTEWMALTATEPTGAPSTNYQYLMLGLMALVNEMDRSGASMVINKRDGTTAATAVIVDGQETAYRGAYS